MRDLIRIGKLQDHRPFPVAMRFDQEPATTLGTGPQYPVRLRGVGLMGVDQPFTGSTLEVRKGMRHHERVVKSEGLIACGSVVHGRVFQLGR